LGGTAVATADDIMGQVTMTGDCDGEVTEGVVVVVLLLPLLPWQRGNDPVPTQGLSLVVVVAEEGVVALAAPLPPLPFSFLLYPSQSSRGVIALPTFLLILFTFISTSPINGCNRETILRSSRRIALMAISWAGISLIFPSSVARGTVVMGLLWLLWWWRR